MFARFNENPAMTLQDIKETKRDARTHAQTDGQRENSIPTTNKVCGGYNDLKACNLEHLLRSNTQNYSHLKALYIKAYIRKVVLKDIILSKIIFSEPNSFMHMFNMSILYRQHIKLLHQKLW